MKGDVRLFLEDIRESLEDIEDFSKGITKKNFLKNKLRQSAIIRKLEIIGEAVKSIPNSFRDKYPGIPWKKIAGFRDVLVHAYFGVNIERIWNIIKKDIPVLKRNFAKINE